MRYAMRWVITRVLPEPAPARISKGPSTASTAARCCGFNLSSRCCNGWSLKRALIFLFGGWSGDVLGSPLLVYRPRRVHKCVAILVCRAKLGKSGAGFASFVDRVLG